MQKPSTKYYQKLSNNIEKASHTMIMLNLFQGHKDGSKYANQPMWDTTLTKGKKKYHMIFSVYVETAFDKTQYSFMIKSLLKTGMGD